MNDYSPSESSDEAEFDAPRKRADSIALDWAASGHNVYHLDTLD